MTRISGCVHFSNLTFNSNSAETRGLLFPIRYLVMITPSRWFAGGMGLDEYRKQMLSDRHLKYIVDFSLSSDCFPGVDIAGGVSYFCWDSSYQGDCFYTHYDGGVKNSCYRKLDEYEIFVRDNRALSILKKVQKKTEKSVAEIMSSLGPFGLGTACRGQDKSSPSCYRLRSSAGYSYIEKKQVITGQNFIDKWNVIIGKATSAGAATPGKDGKRKVIATIETIEPQTVCTFSYFIGGSFKSFEEAENYREYLSTKFSRFLLLQALSSINLSKERFIFVPMQDFSQKWDDEKLCAKYGLSDDEIAFIDSMIRPME